MSDPGSLAATQAAFDAAMAAARERQDFYASRPGLGVMVPSDRPEWHPPGHSPVPKGLGFALPPEAAPVFVSTAPSAIPAPLDVPQIDTALSPAVTGVTHGGWPVAPVPAAQGGSVAYVDAGPPPRRSLWQRLTGRG